MVIDIFWLVGEALMIQGHNNTKSAARLQRAVKITQLLQWMLGMLQGVIRNDQIELIVRKITRRGKAGEPILLSDGSGNRIDFHAIGIDTGV